MAENCIPSICHDGLGAATLEADVPAEDEDAMAAVADSCFFCAPALLFAATGFNTDVVAAIIMFSLVEDDEKDDEDDDDDREEEGNDNDEHDDKEDQERRRPLAGCNTGAAFTCAALGCSRTTTAPLAGADVLGLV
jgi:hypothetical protein